VIALTAGSPAAHAEDAYAALPRPVLLKPAHAHPPALSRGASGARVALLQQRLAWLGYDVSAANIARQRFGASTRDSVRAFQAKNWLPSTGKVDRTTWRRLSGYAEPLGVLPLRCTEVAAAICVDKTTRTLRYVVDGQVVLTTDARFGRPGMETDEGMFTVKEKAYDHTSTLFGTWMPRAMFFSGDQAVHYSPDFNAYGYVHGSHGCIGIRDLDTATRLFDQVDVGTRVYVYWS
jgi:lipoprotein-anchoring transpeptidase ErfK/SrfK